MAGSNQNEQPKFDKTENMLRLPEVDASLSNLRDRVDARTLINQFIRKSQEQVRVGTTMLQLAMLPRGEFNYSPELMETLRNGANQVLALSRDFRADTGEEDATGRMARAAERLQERVIIVKEALIDRFLKDNLVDDLAQLDLKKFLELKRKRLLTKMSLEGVASQMKICRCLAWKDENGARAASKEFLLQTLFGLSEDSGLHSDITRKIVESLTDVHLHTMRQYVLPLLQEQISAYAERGRDKAFVDRAKQTWDITRDWFMTPFDEGARQRMTKAVTPLVSLEVRGGYDQLIPIIRDLGALAGKASWDKGEIVDLYNTIAGTVEFDALMILLTLGAGSAVKAAHVTGTTGKALGVVAAGGVAASKARNMVMNPLRGVHHMVNLLTVEDIKRKVEGFVDAKSDALREKIHVLSQDPEVVAAVRILRNVAKESGLTWETVLDHTEDEEVRKAVEILKKVAMKHGVELPGV